MSRLDLGKVVPEKGIDYWTIQDKQEIENDVKRDIKNINDLTNYELKTNTGSIVEVSVNESTYVVTINLKNSSGIVISTSNIDLPLESVVVNGSYDNSTKKVILTLQNGNTIEFSVADLISGLQNEITQSNKLSSDLVDDTNKTHKFVTSQEKSTWNEKSDFSGDYEDLSNKPTIPSALSDLTDDTTHRLVSDSEKTTWNSKSDFSGSYNDLTNKPTIPSEVTEATITNWGFTKNTGDYTKPVSGIPKTDLSSDVRTSLDKADTALQSYNEQYTGTITGISMNGASKGTSGVVDLGTVITEHQDITGKQDLLVSGTNIKTINNNSILGSGNIEISGGANYTAGTGIDITDNEISCTLENIRNFLKTSFNNDVYVGFYDSNRVLKDNSSVYKSNTYLYDFYTEIFKQQASGKTIIIVDLYALKAEQYDIQNLKKYVPFYVCITASTGSVLTKLQFEGADYLFYTEDYQNAKGMYQRRDKITINNYETYYYITNSLTQNITGVYLDTTYTGNNVFIPTNNNHPANKKYVDDTLLNIAPLYSSSSSYSVGDYVIYNNLLYVCNTTISSGESWNLSHWTRTTVAQIINDLKNSI